MVLSNMTPSRRGKSLGAHAKISNGHGQHPSFSAGPHAPVGGSLYCRRFLFLGRTAHTKGGLVSVIRFIGHRSIKEPSTLPLLGGGSRDIHARASRGWRRGPCRPSHALNSPPTTSPYSGWWLLGRRQPTLLALTEVPFRRWVRSKRLEKTGPHILHVHQS